MDRAEKIRRIEAHYRSFWQGDVADFDKQLAPDFVDTGVPTTPEQVKANALGARGAFPDMAVTIDEAVVEGPVVAVRATWRGTHLGSMMGQAPTGRPVTFSLVVIWEFDDAGRIVRRYAPPIDVAALLRAEG